MVTLTKLINYKYLPSSPQTHLELQNIPTPFLPANQLAGDFRPMGFDLTPVNAPDAPANHYEQPSGPQYKYKIQIQRPQPTPVAAPPTSPHIELAVPQIYQTYSNEEPHSFVTPSTFGKVVNAHQLHQSSQEPIDIERPEPIAQPLFQSRPAVHQASPISHQQQGPIRTNPNNVPRKGERPSPSTIFKSAYYNQYDYGLDLDPDDGYGSKVPMYFNRHPNTGRFAAQIEHHTEATPIIASPTPFQERLEARPHPNPFEPQHISYDHSTDRKPVARPTAAAPPPVVHQHLTEITHLRPHTQKNHPHHAIGQHYNHQYPTSQPNIYSHPQITPSTTHHYEPQPTAPANHHQQPDYDHVLHKLQQTHLLPETLTAGNFEGSIQQLVTILNGLKHQQKQQHHISEIPSQHVGEEENEGPVRHTAIGQAEQGHDYGDYLEQKYGPPISAEAPQQQPPAHHHQEEPQYIDGPNGNHNEDVHDNGDYVEEAYPDEKDQSGAYHFNLIST